MRLLLIALLLASCTTAPARPSTPSWLSMRDGVTAPQFPLADAVRETVWVGIGMDSDGDGAEDRVAADIIRPATPERIPVIMVASPYFLNEGRGNDRQRKTHESGKPVQFPLFLDNYFVPRGYAVVQVDLAGSGQSTGCLSLGGQSEPASATSVIDWLNGRRPGFASDSSQVRASWASGDVGMIGKSWDATVAIEAATTGVAGLKTIVPIAGISDWQEQFRSQGLQRVDGVPQELVDSMENKNAADRCTAVSPAGAERDASKVTASVFAVHGRADMNVVPLHTGRFLQTLPPSTPRKLWLTQVGHVDPFDYRRAEWVAALHRWFDRWLFGVPNGIDTGPVALVEHSPDTFTETAWPGSGTQVLYPSGDALGVSAGTGQVSFTDDGTGNPDSWLTSGAAVFRGEPLAEDLRISGLPEVSVTASSSTTSAHLSVYLMDLGAARERVGEGITKLTAKSCWGEARPGDEHCFFDTAPDITNVAHRVVARGWADLTPVPDVPRTITVRLSTTDHLVPAGHRLALVVGGNEGDWFVAPAVPPRITLDLAGTRILLPVPHGSG